MPTLPMNSINPAKRDARILVVENEDIVALIAKARERTAAP